jgi:hypothetical protein
MTISFLGAGCTLHRCAESLDQCWGNYFRPPGPRPPQRRAANMGNLFCDDAGAISVVELMVDEVTSLFEHSSERLNSGAFRKNRLHKLLDDAGIKLGGVVSDIDGV